MNREEPSPEQSHSAPGGASSFRTEPASPGPVAASGGCCSVRWAVMLVAFLYALDQGTKLWTVRHFALGERLEFWGGVFAWVHFSNTGAAFGIMQDSNRFFIGLSVVALMGIGWCLRKRVFPGALNYYAQLLLIAGILGNLTDRFLHQYVVDFLYFDFGFAPFNPWPAFNVADSCICVAAGLLLLASFQEELARRKSLRR